MNVRAIATADTLAAVNNVKKTMSRNFDYGVSFRIPEEFVNKREYMQSKAFINDADNLRMFSIIDEIMKYRDVIKKEIDSINDVLRDKFTQAVNGFARESSVLEKDYNINFNETETLKTPTQIQYRLLKDVLLPNLAKSIKQDRAKLNLLHDAK